MASFISTHKRDELTAAFDKLPKPRGAKLMTAVSQVLDAVPESVLGGIKIKPFQRLLKRATDDRRIAAAAWRWLRPDDDPDDSARLVDLQRKAGLSHLTHLEFCRKLMDACQLVGDSNEPLSRYVDARVAEIEYKVVPDRVSPGFEMKRLEPFQRTLLRTAMASSRSPDTAAQYAKHVLGESLAAVAAAVASVLDEKYPQPGCIVSATLMFPIETGTTISTVSDRLGDLSTQRAAKKAATLWAELRGDLHRIFVVVAEWPGSSRVGFWVPDVRHRADVIAGAPRAFNSGSADGVFVDDLSAIPGDNDVTEAKWKHYLGGGDPEGFSGRMFLSLPVEANISEKQFAPVAVVNVNVDGSRLWKRAYSRAWLDRATEIASPWMATAWHAYGIAHELEEAAQTRLEPGVLPFAGVLRPRVTPTPLPEPEHLSSSDEDEIGYDDNMKDEREKEGQ